MSDSLSETKRIADAFAGELDDIEQTPGGALVKAELGHSMTPDTLQQWYDTAERIVIDQYGDDQVSFVAAMTLLNYSHAIKQGSGLDYDKAKQWFRDRDRPGVSLEMVCEILYMNVSDVQRRCKLMEERDEKR